MHVACPELSATGFEMLHIAVTVAKEHQVRSVQGLTNRLLELYPQHAAAIDEAIHFWANSVKQRHPNGVPRCD